MESRYPQTACLAGQYQLQLKREVKQLKTSGDRQSRLAGCILGEL